MAKMVKVPGAATEAAGEEAATTNVEAISDFLASDALPVLLIAVVTGFLGAQFVRWYMMSRRSRHQE